jgi:hypothetical protein
VGFIYRCYIAREGFICICIPVRKWYCPWGPAMGVKGCTHLEKSTGALSPLQEATCVCYECVCVCVCERWVCMCVYISVCICIYLGMYTYVYLCIHMYTYICVYICVYMCTVRTCCTLDQPPPMSAHRMCVLLSSAPTLSSCLPSGQKAREVTAGRCG